MSKEYSVYQWFPDGSYERVREWVDIEEAKKAFIHYTNNVATKMGITQRVIVTDGWDCTIAEWVKGKGIIFDPPWDYK